MACVSSTHAQTPDHTVNSNMVALFESGNETTPGMRTAGTKSARKRGLSRDRCTYLFTRRVYALF